MRKRIPISLLLAFALLFTLAACGGQPPASGSELVSTSLPQSVPADSGSVSDVSAPPAATGDKPDFGPLSDDIYAFQVEINGEVYQFPMSFAQFTAFGWTYKDDENTMLDSKRYTVGERFEKDGMECTVHIVNFDVNAIAYKDAYIGGISLDWYMTRNSEDVAIRLAKDIEYGVSTAADARAAYGTPTYENVLSSGTEIVEYEKDYDRLMKMTFDSETGLLSDIQIENYIEPDDFVAGAVSDEVPAIVGKYAAPAALSDDFADWQVEYDGKLCQLPAPVSAFEADGWVIDEESTQMTIDGRGSGWLLMRKDNQKLKVIATNYSEGATAVSNCFVCDVLSDPYDAKLDLKVAKGIAIGTAEAGLQAAISGLELKEESSASYRYYKVMPTGSLVDCYEFYMSTETGLVYKIEVTYQPKYADYTSR